MKKLQYENFCFFKYQDNDILDDPNNLATQFMNSTEFNNFVFFK